MKQKTVTELGDRRRVFICSPLRPRKGTPKEQQMEVYRNLELARLASRYAVLHGCNPMAPHLFVPAFLDDTDPEEREIGIELGLDWLMDCDEMWVIGSRISEGMRQEITAAQEMDIPVVRLCFVGDPIKTLTELVFDEGEDDEDDEDEGEDETEHPSVSRKCRFHYDGGEDEPYFRRTEVDDDEEGQLYDGD